MTSIERRELQQRDKSGRTRMVVRYKLVGEEVGFEAGEVERGAGGAAGSDPRLGALPGPTELAEGDGVAA
jgi:hypothetical protein